MNTKKIPAITMLVAGLLTLILINVKEFQMNLNSALTTLLLVLLSFYMIGILIKVVADLCMKRIEADERKKKELLQDESGVQDEQIEQEAQ